MKPSPVDRTFDPLSNGMYNSFLPKCHLEHYSTEATNYRSKRIITVYNKKCEFATNNRSKITIKVCFDLNLLFMKIIVRWKKNSIDVNE